ECQIDIQVDVPRRHFRRVLRIGFALQRIVVEEAPARGRRGAASRQAGKRDDHECETKASEKHHQNAALPAKTSLSPSLPLASSIRSGVATRLWNRTPTPTSLFMWPIDSASNRSATVPAS